MCGDSWKSKWSVGMTPETALFPELLAKMALAHRLEAARAGRVSSPSLHCCRLTTSDINIMQERGSTWSLRPPPRHAESESALHREPQVVCRHVRENSPAAPSSYGLSF